MTAKKTPRTLDAVRADVRATRGAIDALRSLPPSRSETLSALRARLEQAARPFDERLHRSLVRWAHEGGELLPVSVGGRGTTVDLLPAFAALVGVGTVLNWLAPFIQAAPEGIDAAEREAKLCELSERLDVLELEEETLVVASESAGDPVARRADARPEIVLALAEMSA